jgi:hypothetical protein
MAVQLRKDRAESRALVKSMRDLILRSEFGAVLTEEGDSPDGKHVWGEQWPAGSDREGYERARAK